MAVWISTWIYRYPDNLSHLSGYRYKGQNFGGYRYTQVCKRPKDGRTFRIRGVPLDWDTECLISFLEEHEGSAGAIVKSLAHEMHGRSRTATITFQNVPLELQTLRTGQTWSILIPKPSENHFARNQYLTLDDDFLGITTLYAPPPEGHKVDIIAISGLGGHAFGSFKERGGNYMWLRDSLPYDITHEGTDDPMVRVMIYGYESSVAQSKSIQNLEDLATSFHTSLRALASSPTIRPVIFVAHSLGGLIVKQALITLSKSTNEDDVKLVRAVYGVVFFGVPHNGMDISSLVPMVGDGPNRFLIESIGRINSQILSIQQREFPTALGREGDSEIVCFYETVESPTAQKDGHGNWAMTGPTAVLVTKSSATHCRSWEDGPEHICAVARTHSNMVKFGPQDHEYEYACERLKGLARRALTARHRIQASDTKFLVPYTQNHDFVERSEVLKKLKLQLGYGQRQGPVKPRSRVSLFGLGGVGKTQIALAYVYWLQDTCPDVSVFWVHASNTERFQQAYASIAQKYDIPGYDDPKVDVLLLVKTWLENKFRSRWLMVIDHADDTELFFRSQQERTTAHPFVDVTETEGSLGRYIPECAHGSILITTRNKQAGLRLARGKRPIEVGRMTDSEADQLMRAILEDDEISTEETSLLSSRLEHLPLALAQAAAYVQENCISIREYIKLLDESEAVERWRRVLGDEHPSTLTSMGNLAATYMDQGRWNEAEELEVGVMETRKRVLGEEHPDTLISMANLASTYSDQGRWEEAEELEVGVMETRKRVLGEEHPDTLISMANLASTYKDRGRWEEAEELEVGVMEARKRVLGEEHPDTLISMSNLAFTRKGQGRSEDALALMRNCAFLRQRRLGSDHPRTRSSLAVLLEWEGETGQY